MAHVDLPAFDVAWTASAFLKDSCAGVTLYMCTCVFNPSDLATWLKHQVRLKLTQPPSVTVSSYSELLSLMLCEVGLQWLI